VLVIKAAGRGQGRRPGSIAIGGRERGVVGELEDDRRIDPMDREGAPYPLGAGDRDDKPDSAPLERREIDRPPGRVEGAGEGAREVD
jgi:hypothetical protein